ncbi:class I SAM-dependent methyltransferase, partial [Rhizobium johnstonii]|uniref:class I SAM-dependent methyltransferase n=1 Tax=Rhizobium johnstonii TaxID=3019933 RepID=UPI003F987EA9
LHGVHDVLDVATGTGLVLRALRQDAGLTLYGVDISEGMLAVARRELPDGRVLAAEATDLPFTDAQFDLVTCVTALQLIPDADAALR